MSRRSRFREIGMRYGEQLLDALTGIALIFTALVAPYELAMLETKVPGVEG